VVFWHMTSYFVWLVVTKFSEKHTASIFRIIARLYTVIIYKNLGNLMICLMTVTCALAENQTGDLLTVSNILYSQSGKPSDLYLGDRSFESRSVPTVLHE
jgi:hypothetical protein